MTYQRGQLKDAIKKLPKELQDLMLDPETENRVISIGEKHHLHIDLIGELNDEVILVLSGLAKYSDFVPHIIQRLNIDQTTASAITTDINNEIFLPIRESLQQLADNKVAAPAPVAAITPAPAAPTPTVTPNSPTTPAAPEKNIFEEKMGAMFNLPKEEKMIDPYLEPPE